jgi:hypothetical protein
LPTKKAARDWVTDQRQQCTPHVDAEVHADFDEVADSTGCRLREAD